MPSIRCPYCQHVMVLKNLALGRFNVPCKGCQLRFSLVVSGDDLAHAHVEAQALSATGEAAAAQAATHQTAASQTAIPASPSVSSPAPAAKPKLTATAVAATMAPGATSMPTPTTQSAPVSRLNDTMPAPSNADRRPPATAPASSLAEGPELTGAIGGYQVMRKLGQGGMGAVYLARQVSLDRNVALKVLPANLAADPQFVSRFTREAYAAAQLSHHNVVQIHDIGVDRDTHYFSMEFVEGQTLAGVVREAGKVDPEQAVGYVLQAARGLQFAHEHGLIHRDIKPDNLLLNDQGLVKVADLGLVKRSGVADVPTTGAAASGSASPHVTQASQSMGTPAYMPPEQARDAATVDSRADIYSLGCTLYDLLTGRPPFTGKTVMEVLTKHAVENPVPPDRVVKHVSPVLSAIVLKMTAKRPEDRYASMAEVIRALEEYLGIESGKPFSPSDEHVKVLEFAVDRFNGSKWARIRKLTIQGFFLVTALAAVICALPSVDHPLIAGGLIGFGLLTFFFYQLTIGITSGTYVFKRFRQLVFGASIGDWFLYAIGAALFVMLLIFFNLHYVWLGFAVGALGVALAFHFTIDLAVAKETLKPVTQTEGMLRQMRLKGLDENSIRQFVCRYAGQKWEGFFEAMFGYEAKLQARTAWGKGERGKDRPKHGAWRDAAIYFIDQKMRSRQEARERKMLAKLEAKALAAKGIDAKIASRQAKANAERIVEKAATIKEDSIRRLTKTTAPGKTSSEPTKAAAVDQVVVVQPGWMDHEEGEPEGGSGKDRKYRKQSAFRRRHGTPLDMLVGPKIRFAAAALVLAGFGMWWSANGGMQAKKESADVLATAVDPTELADSKHLADGKVFAAVKDLDIREKHYDTPLEIKLVPGAITRPIGSWYGLLAGVLLLFSLLFGGKRLGISVLVGAAVILYGSHLPLPLVSTMAWLPAAVGAAIMLLGIFFFRAAPG